MSNKKDKHTAQIIDDEKPAPLQTKSNGNSIQDLKDELREGFLEPLWPLLWKHKFTILYIVLLFAVPLLLVVGILVVYLLTWISG